MNKAAFFTLLFFISLFAYGQDDRTVISGSKTYSNKHRTSNGVSSQEIEYDGTIVFNASDTDVESISRGGFLKITKKTFGTKRTVLLEGKSNGLIERTFTVSGREEPWEPEGRQWLADNLLDVIRATGIGAEARVNRFYRAGGLEAVFEEIDEINSSFIKGKYFTATVEIAGLNTRQYSEIIAEASEEIGSDFETSRFLIQNSKIFAASDATLDAVIEYNSEISSDFEQSRVLLHYIGKEDFTDKQRTLFIRAANDIGSDFEQSRVLQAYLKSNKLNDAQMDDLMTNIDNVDSDFEFARILNTAIQTQDLTASKISSIIQASNEISSDFEQSRVLMSLGNQRLGTENLMMIAEATQNISSDFEKSRVLKSILSDLSADANIGFIIDATEGINSDFEQSRILQIVASNKLTSENYEKVILASDNISSNFEKKRVLETLIKSNDLDRSSAIFTLDAIEEVSSNFEKSSLLVMIGPKLPDDDQVKDRFREVARTISSDFEYGKVMRSVDF